LGVFRVSNLRHRRRFVWMRALPLVVARIRAEFRHHLHPRRLFRILLQRFEVHFPVQAELLDLRRGRAWSKKVAKLVRDEGIQWNQLEHLYVHVPKCGGTSIRAILQQAGFKYVSSTRALLSLVQETKPNGPTALTIDHMRTDLLVELGLVSPELLNRIVSFASVRNPYSRVLSAYRHQLEARIVSRNLSIETYLSRLEKWSGGTAFQNVFGLSHALPASYFLRPKLWSGPRTLLKIEETREIEEFLEQVVGFSVALPHERRGSFGAQAFLAPHDLARVTRIYAQDFQLLDYDPGFRP
jgi:hypothetical protein